MRRIALLIALCGCSNDNLVVVTDSGRACITSTQLVAGQPAIIRYDPARCLSSSCDRERFGECSASTTDRVIRVTSHFEWTRPGGNPVCTDDCSGISATCETDPLVDGTYELRFGASTTLTLTVPSQHAEPPCVDVPN